MQHLPLNFGSQTQKWKALALNWHNNKTQLAGWPIASVTESILRAALENLRGLWHPGP